MRRYFAGALMSSICIALFVTIAHAANQDRYYHYSFNHDRQLTFDNMEVLYASDDEATTRSYYTVYHVIDSNGQPHTLWYSATYTIFVEGVGWQYAGGWSLTQEDVDAFLDEHLGPN